MTTETDEARYGLPELLTVREASQRLRINRSTAYEWAASGRLPILRIGGRMCVPASEVQRLLDGVAE